MRTVGKSNWTISLNSPPQGRRQRRSSHIFGEWPFLEDSRYTSQVNSTGEPPPRREAQRNRVASIAHPSQGMAVAQLQAIEERLRYRFQSTEVNGALRAARRAHLHSNRRRRPGGGSAVRWNSGDSHGRASAHFTSIRICRQQLGRRDVRRREQGFDALNMLPNVSSLLRSAPRTGLV